MKILYALLLLSMSSPVAAQTPQRIWENTEQHSRGRTVREVWYADTTQRPFAVSVYREVYYNGRLSTRQLAASGPALLAGSGAFQVIPSRLDAINRDLTDKNRLITSLGFHPVADARWLVRTGTWNYYYGTVTEQARFRDGGPFRLELDTLAAYTVPPGADEPVLTLQVLDSGLRADAVPKS